MKNSKSKTINDNIVEKYANKFDSRIMHVKEMKKIYSKLELIQFFKTFCLPTRSWNQSSFRIQLYPGSFSSCMRFMY